jgi:plastocyanin
MLHTHQALCSLLAIAILTIWAAPPLLGEEATASLTIRDVGFEPTTLEVKAGVKFELIVENTTSKAAEFESSELNREKIVPAGGSVRINIGPLAPGSYSYVDDFNKSHRGAIVAK